MLELFQKLLGDDSMGVRVWTVRALGKVSEFIEVGEDAEIVSLGALRKERAPIDASLYFLQAGFQALVPGIVQVVSQTLEASDEAGAKSVFEVLEGLTLSVSFCSTVARASRSS